MTEKDSISLLVNFNIELMMNYKLRSVAFSVEIKNDKLIVRFREVTNPNNFPKKFQGFPVEYHQPQIDFLKRD